MALKLIQGKQITVNLTGSFTGSFSGSFNGTSSYATNALSASYANVTASLGYTPQYRLFTDSTFAGDPTTTSEPITRTGNISLKGANVYYTTQQVTDSNYGTSFGHVTSTHSTGFIAMFASQSGHNTGNNNMIIGNVPSASITNPQSTFISVKDIAYNPWTDSRLLFRFQNGYQSGRVSLFEIGTDYIRLPIHTSSRNDSGSAISNLLFTDTTGILRSRPISAIATFPYTGSAIISGSLGITGSLNVNGGITGSLFGTASYAISSSNALTASYLMGGVSIDTGSLLTTASFNSYTGSSTSQFAGTSSFASTASFAPLYLPLTGGTIDGNVTVNGTASIAFLNVTYESASVIYSSGSNVFGDATNDTQTLNGTVIVSGSQQITGSLRVSSSEATQLLVGNVSTNIPAYGSVPNVVIGSGSNGGVLDIRNTSTTSPDTTNVGTVQFSVQTSGIGTYTQTQLKSISAGGQSGGDSGGGHLTVLTNPGGTGKVLVERMRVNSNGQVLIGLTSSLDTTSNLIVSGSTVVTGSLNVTQGITGSLFGTASYATQALTASFATQATTASYVLSSSYAEAARTVGITTQDTTPVTFNVTFTGGTSGNNSLGIDTTALTYNPSTSTFTTPIIEATSITGSLFGTASFATQALSASFAISSSRAVSSSFATQASNALTASFVNPLNQKVTITGSLSQGEAGNIASGLFSHAEGEDTQAVGYAAHSEGVSTIASGSYSHAEGQSTIATGQSSHAEGSQAIASGYGSHAEGVGTIASGDYSHAEGGNTTASGSNSHAEGVLAIALGSYSHAEGDSTIAIGISSHAEGNGTTASGSYSHAEGASTIASGDYSHAEGYNTISSGSYQHVQGQFNISSLAQSAFIHGNGTSNVNRSNLIFASGSEVQITGSLQVSGSARITNGLTVTGSLNVTGSITSSGNIVPSSDNVHTLGTSLLRYNNVHSSQGVISNFYTTNIRSSGNNLKVQSNGGLTWAQWFDTTGNLVLQSGSATSPTDDGVNRLQVSGSAIITNGLTVTGSVTTTSGFIKPGAGSQYLLADGTTTASSGGGGTNLGLVQAISLGLQNIF